MTHHSLINKSYVLLLHRKPISDERVLLFAIRIIFEIPDKP
jgi:hypothetical protein